jgi:hypothetical protein
MYFKPGQKAGEYGLTRPPLQFLSRTTWASESRAGQLSMELGSQQWRDMCDQHVDLAEQDRPDARPTPLRNVQDFFLDDRAWTASLMW